MIAFLMEHEHFTYPEAIRFLAKKYNIEIEETIQSSEDKKINDLKESMFLVTEYATQFFENSLTETEQGKSIGLTYLKKEVLQKKRKKSFP